MIDPTQLHRTFWWGDELRILDARGELIARILLESRKSRLAVIAPRSVRLLHLGRADLEAMGRTPCIGLDDASRRMSL